MAKELQVWVVATPNEGETAMASLTALLVGDDVEPAVLLRLPHVSRSHAVDLRLALERAYVAGQEAAVAGMVAGFLDAANEDRGGS